jgi:hypothetical protein
MTVEVFFEEIGVQSFLEFRDWLYDLSTYLSSDSGESFSSIRRRRYYYPGDYPPMDEVIPNYENLTPEERMEAIRAEED